MDLLEEMQEHLQAKGARLVLADPSPKLARLFERSGLKDKIGGRPRLQYLPACRKRQPACRSTRHSLAPAIRSNSDR